MRFPLALLLLVLLAAALAGSAAQAGSPARARAQAALVTGTLGTFADAKTSGDRSLYRRKSVEERGVKIAKGELNLETNRSAADPSARATAAARTVDLLDGLVTAYGVRRQALSAGGEVVYTGRVRGLRISGQMIGDVNDDATYDLPDGGGTVTVNHERQGLALTLTRAHNGYPAGTSVAVADVSANARAAVVDDKPGTKTPTPTATPDDKPAGKGNGKSKAERRRARAARRLRAARARLLGSGFAFPVFGGGVETADDFAAPRATIASGKHEGNDIFGPFGAPVIAVADGTLEKVGTLPVSGNRLWLRTDAGDTFFYAHLSAFSPQAVSGKHVQAGELLGFVGNTGDAEPTPPHLHFEIHPGDGKPLDPHSILAAWKTRDIPPAEWQARYGGGGAPGALVEIRDFIAAP